MTLAALFITISAAYGLPHGLLGSLCFVESAWRPNKVHYDDGRGSSLGTCQVKLSTAQWMGFKVTEKDLMKPAVNIQAAAAYLSYQLRRYHGNIAKAVTAYNQGTTHGDGNSVYYRKVLARWHSRCDQKRCNHPRGRGSHGRR